jgi:HlyD family secretion protein
LARRVDIVRKGLSSRRRTLAGALLGAALVALTAGIWRTSAAAPVASHSRSGVWTERVRRGDLVRQVAAQGTLVPEQVQWLSAASAARVARIAVRPGTEVEADTVVLVLENAELELAALEAERQAASAEAALIQLDVRTLAEQKSQDATVVALRSELQSAEARAAASDRLAPEGLMSDLDHRDAKTKVGGLAERLETEQSRRGVLAAGRTHQLAAQRAELERLREIAEFRKKQLALLEVRAGIRGVVQDIPLESGQWVTVGAVLAKVAEPSRLKAELRVGEAEAKDVRVGLGVRFEAPAGSFRGHVKRVDPAVVRGSVRLEVTIDDPLPSGARADQSVSGYVEIDKLERVLFVARPAGAADATATRLFRLDPDGLYASRVPVLLGKGSAREVEVVGGLSEGDEIVVSDVTSWEASPRVRLK